MPDPRLGFGTDHCKCSACGLYFNSTTAFDEHRRGEPTARRCLSESDMLAKGMGINGRGYWVTKLAEEGFRR